MTLSENHSATADRLVAAAAVLVRLALAAAFLSAVADRLGFWGPPGGAGVAWGSVGNYEAYVAKLNGFLPRSLIPAVGWTATVAEILIAVGLIVGWRTRWVALAGAFLLTTFLVAMIAALGPKPPLDYSVASAAGAAYLLATTSFAAEARRRELVQERPGSKDVAQQQRPVDE